MNPVVSEESTNKLHVSSEQSSYTIKIIENFKHKLMGNNFSKWLVSGECYLGKVVSQEVQLYF